MCGFTGFDKSDMYSEEEYEKVKDALRISDDDDSEPNPNYKCPVCADIKYIDDHKKHAPSWCKHCEDVQNFVKLTEG